MTECGNCRGRCEPDEVSEYALPLVGLVWLCLTCGPQENYADLEVGA